MRCQRFQTRRQIQPIARDNQRVAKPVQRGGVNAELRGMFFALHPLANVVHPQAMRATGK